MRLASPKRDHGHRALHRDSVMGTAELPVVGLGQVTAEPQRLMANWVPLALYP